MKTEFADQLEGRNPVMEALKAGRPINKILVGKGARGLQDLIDLAREQGVAVQFLPAQRIDEMAQTRANQGVLAFLAAKEYVELDDLLSTAQVGEPPLLVFLDGLTDPQNLGSILRTVEAVGATGVVIPERRSVPLNATVAKASAGAMEYVPVARVKNLVRAIDQVKQAGIWVIGADMGGSEDSFHADLSGPIALVVGGEGSGISRLVREHCDRLVHLPMRGKISSLNAAVATSVLLYEVYRQRKLSTEHP